MADPNRFGNYNYGDLDRTRKLLSDVMDNSIKTQMAKAQLDREQADKVRRQGIIDPYMQVLNKKDATPEDYLRTGLTASAQAYQSGDTQLAAGLSEHAKTMASSLAKPQRKIVGQKEVVDPISGKAVWADVIENPDGTTSWTPTKYAVPQPPSSTPLTQTVKDASGNPIIKKTPDGTSWYTEARVDPATGQPIKGSEVDKPLVKPSNADVEKPEKNPGLSGQAYLDTLPTGKKSLVKAVGEGRTKIQTVTSFRGNQKMEFSKDVMRAYPTYDQRWVDASFTLAKDATTGSIAKNARSLNTAIGHLQQFDQAMQNLNNVDITGYNTLANWMAANTGDPRVMAVMVPAKALAAEVASATKGGASGAAGTEQEIKDWKDAFNTSLSKGQGAQAVQSTLNMLGSRISALNEQYKNVPYHPEGFDVISPPAKAILESYNFDFSKYGGDGNAKPAQGGQVQPTQKPKDDPLGIF
jgi:hypothetical protein